MADLATVSYYALPIITGAVSYLVARATKGHEARRAAEAALISAGPEIIEQLNVVIEADRRRLDAQGLNLDKVWEELRKVRIAEQECQDELYKLKRHVGLNGEDD
jgi:hypothetical protein